jgi:DNA-binding MarR family transcriptional regulator
VDGLERGGLVERLPHPRDKRMVQAHLTPEGLEVAAEALPGRNEQLERIWAALDDEELVRVVELLRAAVDRSS